MARTPADGLVDEALSREADRRIGMRRAAMHQDTVQRAAAHARYEASVIHAKRKRGRGGLFAALTVA
ncbi:hypothetical protein [Burkholderia sp. WSM2230]|uniref:hypothetical protein n=1 Tax=Burkholderia sp. WSM2230 TaxID=944435 RepID=UPI000426E9CB|nr:hypothetical protein [Burkholderia sp. WSM2230]